MIMRIEQEDDDDYNDYIAEKSVKTTMSISLLSYCAHSILILLFTFFL